MSDIVLEVEDARFGYGDLVAVWDVSLRAAAGRICALVGRNGAGKTTLCKGIGGLLKLQQGELRLCGRPIAGEDAWTRSERGLSLVQEGKRIFRELTVEENLQVGMIASHVSRREARARVELAYEAFPALAPRREERAASLSGGQQQMLVIAQALVARPKLLIVDEPSSGLAPVIVETILEVVASFKREGMAVILVEQLELVADVADDVVVLERGHVTHAGRAAELDLDSLAEEIYLTAA